MIQITRSEGPAHLGALREQSFSPVSVFSDPRSFQDIRIDSVGVTRSSETVFAVIEFEVLETVDPDTDIAKTIVELAEEQRRFTAGLEGYVDIDMPFDN